MKKVVSIDVFYHKEHVGTISRYNRNSAFQYASQWLNNGFSINPISLPLTSEIFYADWEPFGGIHGVFANSLPDGWGALITDRFLTSKGINISEIDSFERLSFLTDDSYGALEFRPRRFDNDTSLSLTDYDALYSEFYEIAKNDNTVFNYDKHFSFAGSSGGARPKANVILDGKKWIIKYPALTDSKDIGKQEFLYNKTAQMCGISVSEFRLLASQFCDGFFASKRFDYDDQGNKIHCVSVAGLLEADYTLPCIDYRQLFQLAGFLTNSQEELIRVYRLMCFNIFAHNRDDHAKNFSFMCDEHGEWKLSYAYDLTYSNSFNGWHATSVNGNGKNPSIEDAVTLGKEFIPEKLCISIAQEVKEIVERELSQYLRLW